MREGVALANRAKFGTTLAEVGREGQTNGLCVELRAYSEQKVTMPGRRHLSRECLLQPPDRSDLSDDPNRYRSPLFASSSNPATQHTASATATLLQTRSTHRILRLPLVLIARVFLGQSFQMIDERI